MSYFVYVLKSQKDNKHYIGSTSDIKKRLAFHNAGLQRSTKARVPFILIYQEEIATKQEALKRERYIKSLKGGEAFKKLIGIH
jgi:putative endonuclease